MTHQLYTPSDFTDEQYYEYRGVARMVIDGGLGICKVCGAGESQLDDYPTCAEYFNTTQNEVSEGVTNEPAS
jgi:hypothetical protein